MMHDKDKLELSELILELTEGVISSERMEKLDEMLFQSPEALDFYRGFIRNTIVLKRINVLQKQNEELLKSDLWQALAEQEKKAPAVEIAASEEPKRLIQKVQHEKSVRKISKMSLFWLSAAAAAIILIFVFARFAPQETGLKVAVLSDSINAKWADMDGMMEKGAFIFTSRKSLLLREGIVELLFDNQARVTIESPAEFEIVTGDQVKLNYGRLYATVPQSAIGFAVQTSSARIIDLGTEFGVKADSEGVTELHVIKGKTSIITGQNNRRCLEVSEGFARLITGDQGIIKDIPCRHDAFVRSIDSSKKFVWRGQSRICLADIVGGGNGFGTGKLDSGIETNAGRWFETPDPGLVLSKVDGILIGGGSYNKVSGLPFIDGVFVPDSRKGPVQVTSAGHVFDGFIDGREVFWGNIFNGAWHASDTSIKHQLKLNGHTYGTPGNPAISLHSNQGITFDLQSIRQTIPGGRILRFTSLFGVSETVAVDPLYAPKQDGPNWGKVNCWVLIDGKERFNRNSVSYQQGATEIEVDIRDEDRFLTLVVTESDDRRAYDWALFAGPSLLIEMNTD